ncbi:MAG: hypothetical protein HYW69_03355 [Candidatus Nealsonbacteria bacterium]|nr:hypothetical protein [Candidatus Nealsonbacteria bacterium]
MKKIIFTIFVCGLLLGGFNFASAHGVEVNFFYSPTCPHCAKEKAFLGDLGEKYPEVEINQYDVINSRENQELLKSFYEKYDVPKSLQGLVPATFTPTKYFIGFDNKIAKDIEGCLKECLAAGSEEFSLANTSIIDKTFKIPLLGEMELSNFSFPIMAVVLGALDGFNVCSLGALILILSLVMVFHSRKKILLFGLVFILTTAAVYGTLIFFWYKLFEAVAPYLKIMNGLIGVFGIAGGIYFFRQFWKSRKSCPTCESDSGSKISSKFLPKLQSLLKNPSSIFLAIGAVFAFAFILTVVEFPCSAVVPVAFAAVLAKAGLSPSLYILYIALFVLFYLLDEIIVFLFAVFTSRIWLSSPKFLKWIILIEAVILFSFGFYYLLSLI